MGTVWRARDEVLGREVAVKEVNLRSELADEERDLLHHRTLREARATARLNHPGIVTVHDVVDEDDRPWIVMEFVESRSLQDVIEHEGPRPPRWVAEIGRQTLGALRAAHSVGILHRDVKPGNVLITGDGRAVLTDFGIAQVEGDPGLTHTGLLVGSPAYMAPERVRGERAADASDLWALGATLYAACEGRPPHAQGTAMAVMAAVLTQDPPPPRNAGPLTPLLRGLLHRDPAQRMDAGTASDLLSQVADGTAPQPPGTPLGTATMEDPWPAPLGAMARPDDRTAQVAYGGMPTPPPGGHPADLGTTGPGTTGPGTADVGAPRRGGPNAGLLVMVGALVVIVVALVGALLLQDRSHRAASPGTSTSPKTGGSPSVPVSPAGDGSAPAASADPGSGGEASLPTGWRTAQAFDATVGVPPGWRRSQEGASVFWRDPRSAAYLQVDRTPWNGGPFEAWQGWEAEVLAKNALKNYQRVGLRRVDGLPYEAADIEFTWDGKGGVRMRGVDRRIIAGGRRYAVFVAVPAAQWDTSRQQVNGFLDTFVP